MDRQDFTELIASKALDALENEELLQTEQVLADFPDWQIELEAFQEAAAAIAYSAPDVAIAPNLKDRLFQRIAASAATTQPSIASLRQQAQSLDWQPYALVPGVMLATAHIDQATKEVWCFVRSSGAIRFPKHIHAGHEEIVVLDGDLVINGTVYGSGDRVYSQPGTAHQPETLSGCLLFLRTSLDDEILV